MGLWDAPTLTEDLASTQVLAAKSGGSARRADADPAPPKSRAQPAQRPDNRLSLGVSGRPPYPPMKSTKKGFAIAGG